MYLLCFFIAEHFLLIVTFTIYELLACIYFFTLNNNKKKKITKYFLLLYIH